MEGVQGMAREVAVAVLGAGIMGSGMARNLLRAGFAVRVWNRSPERALPLTEAGAVQAASPAEAVSAAHVVITMLADGPAVEDVMGGPSGALTAMPLTSLWLQMSTVGIAATERLLALADRHGVRAFVDAPVLGTREPAEGGQLTVLASGPENLQERCAPIFDAVASRVLWLGPVGTGTRMKLVVNNWLLQLVEALAETLVLARGLGLEPEDFLAAIEGSAIAPAYAGLKGRLMDSGEYPPSFPLRLAHKDMRLVLEAAWERGLSLPAATVVERQFAKAEDAGLGDQDLAAVHEVLRGDRQA